MAREIGCVVLGRIIDAEVNTLKYFEVFIYTPLHFYVIQNMHSYFYRLELILFQFQVGGQLPKSVA